MNRWLFYRPFWEAVPVTLVTRATPAEVETGSWLFEPDRRVAASLEEIHHWVADRQGQVWRGYDSVEWQPESPEIDLETQLRWWPSLNIAAGR